MPIAWTKRAAHYSRLPGVDPALDLVIDPDPDPSKEAPPGQRYYFVRADPKGWLPVVLLLNQTTKISVRDFAKGIPFIPEKKRTAWEGNLRISPFFIDPPEGLEDIKFFSAMVNMDFLNTLVDEKSKLVPEIVARIELSLPLPARSLQKT